MARDIEGLRETAFEVVWEDIDCKREKKQTFQTFLFEYGVKLSSRCRSVNTQS